MRVGWSHFWLSSQAYFDLFSDADFIDVCVTRLWAVLSSGWLCDSREKFVLVTGTIGCWYNLTRFFSMSLQMRGKNISLLSALLEINVSQLKEVLALRENLFSCFFSSAKGNSARSICNLKTTNFVTHPTSPLISFSVKNRNDGYAVLWLHFRTLIRQWQLKAGLNFQVELTDLLK